MSIYNEIFPEKKKATKIPMVNYAIKLSLLAPNNNYNFMDEECDGIDIKGTFSKWLIDITVMLSGKWIRVKSTMLRCELRQLYSHCELRLRRKI